jgi:hypothetical protein
VKPDTAIVLVKHRSLIRNRAPKGQVVSGIISLDLRLIRTRRQVEKPTPQAFNKFKTSRLGVEQVSPLVPHPRLVYPAHQAVDRLHVA